MVAAPAGTCRVFVMPAADLMRLCCPADDPAAPPRYFAVIGDLPEGSDAEEEKDGAAVRRCRLNTSC